MRCTCNPAPVWNPLPSHVPVATPYNGNNEAVICRNLLNSDFSVILGIVDSSRFRKLSGDLVERLVLGLRDEEVQVEQGEEENYDEDDERVLVQPRLRHTTPHNSHIMKTMNVYWFNQAHTTPHHTTQQSHHHRSATLCWQPHWLYRRGSVLQTYHASKN